MTAMTHDAHSTRLITSSLATGALLLAMALAFLAGRVTAVRANAPAAVTSPAAASQPAAAPDWSTHGFRDQESAQDGCVTSDCSG
jgi:hypothetical protein